MEPSNYMIAVGETDRSRLDALGAIYNPTSIQIISSSKARTHRPRMLDVGCGNGSLTNLYAKTLYNPIVLAVDNSQSQLDVSRKSAEEAGLTNIEWNLCDVYSLKTLKEIHPKLFDVVHCRFVLTHLTYPEKACDQMLSMTKPGGLLIIEETGLRKRFKGTPPKCIQAWQKMVEKQYQMQKSHKDTCDKVFQHLTNSKKIDSCHSQLFNIVIDGQLKKSLFRLGVEQGLKTIGSAHQFGYLDDEVWLEELKAFELDDSQTLEIENYECIIAKKKQKEKDVTYT